MTSGARGMLVRVDGPGGVGKTTTVRYLVAILTDAGLAIRMTAQPTPGPVGVLARDLVETASGTVLACG